MMVDDMKLNLLVAPITAAGPDVVPFPRQVNMALNTRHAAIDPVNPYFHPC